MVQPDLFVVCDKNQIQRNHIDGPPAIVIEVLSPATEQHDRRTKRELYAHCGIAEYWIITPFPHLVEVFTLREGLYAAWKTFTHRDTISSAVLPNLTFDLGPIFDFPLDEGEKNLFIVKESPGRYSATAST